MLGLPAGPLFIDSAFNFLFYTLLYNILPFLFILAFCITIHELGHFVFAKISHIPVEKFSIGFGPPIFRKKIGETDFRIAYFPLGGYIKMAGEDEGEITKKEDTQAREEKSVPGFYDVPIYKRIITVFGGPLFNILSAFIIVILSFLIFGISVNPYTKIQVEKGTYADRAGFLNGDSLIAVNNIRIDFWDDFDEQISINKDKEIKITVMRNSRATSKSLMAKPESLGIIPMVPPVLGRIKLDGPAYKAGLREGDRVLKVDSVEIQTWFELVDIIRSEKQKTHLFEWQHQGETKTAYIKPATLYDPIAKDTIGQIGVFMPLVRKYLSPLRALTESANRTGSMLWLTIKIFYQLITREVSTRALGGPIAIARLSSESAHWGLEYLIGLLTIISINLGLINLFPIPAFDGGHIIIASLEAIRRKRFSKNTRMIIQQIGYAIILLLLIFVTFNDITR